MILLNQKIICIIRSSVIQLWLKRVKVLLLNHEVTRFVLIFFFPRGISFLGVAGLLAMSVHGRGREVC